MDLEIRVMRSTVKALKHAFISAIRFNVKKAVDSFKAKRKRGLRDEVTTTPGNTLILRSGKRIKLTEIEVTGREAYNCPQCSKTNMSKRELEIHQSLNSHFDPPLPCKQQYTKREPKRHRGGRYSCPVCAKEIRDIRLFNVHLRTHSECPTEFHCPLCERKYSAAPGLFCHQGWHTSVDGFNCRVCNENFEDIDNLNFHYYGSHMGPYKEIAIKILKTCMVNSKRRVEYKCDHCPLKFYNSKVFKIHILSHEQQSTPLSYSCPLCKDKSFDTLGSLFTHQNWHPTKSECKCSSCDESFDALDNLTIHHHKVHLKIPENALKVLESHIEHRRTKKRTKFHKCELCSEVFQNVRALKVHLTCHGEGVIYKDNRQIVQDKEPGSQFLFSCPLCPNNFRSLTSLFIHQSLHGRGVQITCKLCPEKYTKLDDLTVHFHKEHVATPEKDFQTLEKAMSMKHEELLFRKLSKNKCQYCFQHIDHHRNLLPHVAEHIEEYCSITELKMNCLLCKLEFSSVKELTIHIAKHDLESESWICIICDKVFESLRVLIAHHYKSHFEYATPVMKFIEEDVVRRINLRIYRRGLYEAKRPHARRHPRKPVLKSSGSCRRPKDNEQIVQEKEPSSQILVNCPLCPNKNLKSLTSLFIHQSLHTSDVQFACVSCPEKYTKLDDLTIHFHKEHFDTPEKDFQALEKAIAVRQEQHLKILNKNQCQYCFQQIYNQDYFLPHVAEHIEEYCSITELKMNCLLCKLEFSSVKELIVHIVNHDLQRESWICIICNKMCESLDVLISHHYRSHFEYATPVVKFIEEDVARRIELRMYRKGLYEAKRPFASKSRIPRKPVLKSSGCFRMPKDKKKPQSKPASLIIQKNYMRTQMKSTSNGDTNETYVCIVCEEEFDTAGGLSGHFQRHTGSELAAVKGKGLHENPEKTDTVLTTTRSTLECEGCSEVFFNIFKYRKHLIDAHSKKKDLLKRDCYICPICEDPSPSTAILLTHLKTFHFVFAQCPVCELVFDTQETFVAHVDENHPEFTEKGHKFMRCSEGYLCKTCGKISPQYGAIESHFLRCHSERSFECEFCKVKFATQKTLTSHIQAVHGEKPFCCDQCGKRFHQKTMLAAHITKSHLQQSDSKRIKCSQCEQSFSGVASYKVHFTAFHTTEKPYQCSVCGRAFAVQSTYHIHKTTVCEKEKAKEATCPICQKKLPNYVTLFYHKANIHRFGNTEETVCHLCNKSFSSTLGLYSHNNTYHNNTSMECSECGKVQPNSNFLFSHWVTHWEDKPFKCTLCGLQFKQRTGFYSHRKLKHEEDKGVKCIIDKGLYKSMHAKFKEAHKDQYELLWGEKKKLKVGMEAGDPPIPRVRSQYLQCDSSADDNDKQDQLSNVEDPQNIENKNYFTKVPDSCNDLSPSNESLDRINHPVLNYVDFSRANIKERILEPEVPSDEMPTAKDDNVEQMPLIPESVLTEPTEVNDEWETSGIPSPEVEFNDDVPVSDCFEQLEPPASVYYDDDVNEEDIKPIIKAEKRFPEDPFAKQLVIVLKRLPNYSCSICGYVCHTAEQSRKHTNTRSHRSAAKELREGSTHVLKNGKQERSDSIEETRQKCKSNINIGGLICKICKEELPDQESMEEHMICHSKIVCSVCSEEFSSKPKLIDHIMKEHDGESISTCEICGKGFLNKYSVRRHKESSHGIPYVRYAVGRPKSPKKTPSGVKQKRKCDICGKLISLKSSLKRHKTQMHGHPYVRLPRGIPKGFKYSLYSSQVVNVDEIEEDPNFVSAKSKKAPREKKKRGRKPKIRDEAEFNKEKVVLKPHTCYICGEKMCNLIDYQNHIEAHRIEKLKCVLCDQVFDLLDALASHCQETHDGVFPFQCDKCPKGYVTMYLLKLHKTDFHPEENDKNDQNQNSNDKNNIPPEDDNTGKLVVRKKRPRRFRPRPFYCVTCCSKVSFSSEEKLKQHIAKAHQDGKMYDCEFCGKSFPSAHAAHAHRKLHVNNEKAYCCNHCDKYYDTLELLCQHTKESHADIKKEVSLMNYRKIIRKDVQTFICEMCGKVLSSQENLDSHRRIHTGERPFQCSICGLCCISKRSLRNHTSDKHSEKQYICDECGKSFKSKRNLIDHRRLHTGERPFPCSRCDRTFSSYKNRMLHIQVDHMGRRHPCTICGKEYRKAHVLKKHLESHSGEK